MKHNLLHRQRALFLRIKKGYSYSEILTEVPVAKSTLSLWLRPFPLTAKQRERLHKKVVRFNWNLGEWNREKRQQEISNIRVKAKQEIGLLSRREFLITGVMLYWAEGSKDGSEVLIANADPVLICLMMAWFRKFLPITEDHFRASIHYHEGQNEDQIKKFWSQLTDIPLTQFQKSFRKPPGTGHRTHYLQWGVCRIRIRRSSNLYHEIAGWKDGLIKEIISGKTVK